MTQYLPPNLLALFAPRDPIPYMVPMDKLPSEKKLPPYRGVAELLEFFEDPKDTPPPTRVETKDEKRERKRKERQEQVAYQLEQDLALWDPANDPTIVGDAFKTLFVGRINYDTSESKLRREFEVYGPVKRLKIIYNNRNNKPRGCAFIEYEHERDMHSAYKHADGKKIDGRRVLVDVERGRTIKGWRPRRLGGGLGGTRKGGPDVNTKFSGREDGSSVARDDRSRSRDRRRRSRSRERGGDRGGGDRGGDRRRRSRSPRERKPRIQRSRSPRDRRRDRPPAEEAPPIPTEGDFADIQVKIEGRKKHRSRSRDRGAERPADGERRRRSRSRDRPERRSRRSRSRDRKRRRSRERRDENGVVRVKQEQGPVYPGEDENYGMANNSFGEGPMPPQDDQEQGPPQEPMPPQGPPPPPPDSYGPDEYGAPPPPINDYGAY